MATLSAKKITEALKKAQKIGRAEEPLTIDGCSFVLQSLRPDEYAVIHETLEEIPEGIGYLNAFKREHLCRSICEFNEVDLRDIDFVEVDVEIVDEKTKKPVVKTVKVETYAFVRDYILGSWAREAIDVAFRKFNDAVAKAEKIASEGITFVVPDESVEDKYRRLLAEAKDIEGHVPVDLSVKIREELGYLTTPTQVELEAANEKLSKIGELQPEPTQEVAPEAAPEPTSEAAPTAATPKARAAQRAPVVAKPLPQEDQPTPDEIMQARQPLNQRPVEVPVPTPAMQANPVIPANQAVLKKSAQIAAMEGESSLDPPLVQGGTQIVAVVPGADRADRTPMELSRPLERVNPSEAERIFEQPPTAGINPRFRKPQQF
jgi:hypothetical protein